MIYIIIALVLAMCFVLGLYLNQRHETGWQCKNSCFWSEKYTTLLDDYTALDQGMTETQDAYATDSAQYEDTIGSLRAQLDNKQEELDNVRASHFLANDRNTALQLDNLDLQTCVGFLSAELQESKEAALAMQQTLTTHNAVCLPTLG